MTEQHAFPRSATITLAMCVLSGCSTLHMRNNYAVDVQHRANAYNQRISSLVLHYTAQPYKKSLATLTGDRVSSHYLVPEKPDLYRNKPIALALVDENLRAWHAGVSFWEQRSGLNDTSIGIEIVNPGYIDTEQGRVWYPYPEDQIDLVIRLCKDIITRYGIMANRVVGHSDIAPQRKYDPGPLFPWKRLADNGIGAWPDKETVAANMAQATSLMDITQLQQKLKKYGYAIELTGEFDEQTRNVVQAFQMHFRPTQISGESDIETEAILNALLSKYHTS